MNLRGTGTCDVAPTRARRVAKFAHVSLAPSKMFPWLCSGARGLHCWHCNWRCSALECAVSDGGDGTCWRAPPVNVCGCPSRY